MGRRRLKSHADEEVTLNLAAMLDMAFQLLSFFILTFQQPAQEGQILLRLPPPIPIGAANGKAQAGEDKKNKDPVIANNTLIINVYADPRTGLIDNMAIGAAGVSSLAALDGELKKVFSDKGLPFDQVVIQVGESCRYEELMRVIDICTHQVLPDGKKLSKLSFVALPDS
jgi:biopolymer transport protein ExbD